MEGSNEINSRSDARLDKLIEMVLDLTTKVRSLETVVEKGLGVESLDEKIEEAVNRKVEEVMEEQQDIERRKKNVIIVGLRESAKETAEERRQDDLNAAKSLLGKLVNIEEQDVKEPIRLGRAGGHRPRMLKVTMNNEDKKREAVKKSPELNAGVTEPNKRVYINHDYTPRQRQKYKELKEEKQRRTDQGEENLVIRNGKVMVKTAGRTEEPRGAEGGIDPREKGGEKNNKA
jgi:hypothetical protein